MEEILLFNKFFSDCRYIPWLRRYSPTKLCDGPQMAIFCIILRTVFPASREEKKRKKKKPQGKNIMSASATHGRHNGHVIAYVPSNKRNSSENINRLNYYFFNFNVKLTIGPGGPAGPGNCNNKSVSK